MNEGLEAFSRILESDYFTLIMTPRTDGKAQFANDIAIVKKELKQSEELKTMYSNCVIEGAKQKKVLEFIKDYALYIDWTWLFDCIINNRSYEDYIEGCIATNEKTFADKEEYDLLKEVLIGG